MLHYICVMKNITITLDEELARWVRIRAAEMDKSVSRLVAELLKDHMLEEQGFRASMQQFLSSEPGPLKKSGKYPAREDLHER